MADQTDDRGSRDGGFVPTERTPVGPRTTRQPKKSELVAREIAAELVRSGATGAAGTVVEAEEDLMARLDVSRGTLREGLRLLEVLGVVESRMGRAGGVVLREPDAQHFAQVITFYLQFSGCTFGHFLEVYAEIAPVIARRAAENISPATAGPLTQAMQTFEELPIDAQVRYVQNVVATYHALVNNPLWELLSRAFHSVISSHLERLLVPEDAWPDVVRVVRRLAWAVANGDADQAESLSRAQSRAWLEIAQRSQPDLLQARVVWVTQDDLFRPS